MGYENNITYFENDLSNMQKLYCCITGYEGPSSAFSSARSEDYFECKTQDEKIEHLDAYASEFVGYLSNDELIKVQSAIDTETSGTHEVYELFSTLK